MDDGRPGRWHLGQGHLYLTPARKLVIASKQQPGHRLRPTSDAESMARREILQEHVINAPIAGLNSCRGRRTGLAPVRAEW